MPEIPALGRRGGGWVVLQLVVFAAITASCVWGPRWPDGLRVLLTGAGVVVALVGAAVVVAAARLLGSSLTPFPKPPREGELVVGGPYRVVRHPIYSGALLFFAGLSLALSPLALVPTGLLLVVFAFKSAVEERFLRAAFPSYARYAADTRYRLVPFVH